MMQSFDLDDIFYGESFPDLLRGNSATEYSTVTDGLSALCGGLLIGKLGVLVTSGARR